MKPDAAASLRIYARPAPQARRRLLLVFREGGEDVARWLETIAARQPDPPDREIVAAFLDGADPGAPAGFQAVDLASLAMECPPCDVYVHARTPNAPDPGLPPAFTLGLADLRIESARGFDLGGRDWPYRRADRKRLRALFLFPGAIIPVDMGSHRRAVTMLAALDEAGFDVTVLHTARDAQSRARARPYLSLIAAAVEGYANTRNWGAWIATGLTRGVHDALRRLVGGPRPPETFRERTLRRCNRSLRIHLGRLDLESFDAVVVNYAWMAPAVLRRRPRRPFLVCDTHDVQYHRAASAAKPSRLDGALLRPEANRRAELATLARMDAILSISLRDAELLNEALGEGRTLVAPSSFAYCHAHARPPVAYAPTRFGFIGHDMEANAMALRLVLDEWWPAIRRFSPDSRLQVAGTICRDETCRARAFLDDSVVMRGFVDTVQGYFAGIDVLLSPVLVAGGVNFKNVEAIAAGVEVLTNPLGAAALRPLRPRRVVETPVEVVDALTERELDPDAALEARRRLQREALRLFRPDEALEKVAAATRARRAG
jgi:hypothetical protein